MPWYSSSTKSWQISWQILILLFICSVLSLGIVTNTMLKVVAQDDIMNHDGAHYELEMDREREFSSTMTSAGGSVKNENYEYDSYLLSSVVDLADPLPDNFTLAIDTETKTKTKTSPKCKCVDCEEDEICGGLWKANKYPGNDDPRTKKIHIVVSHCKTDLDWISDFTKGHNVASIHVITKCGAPVIGAPDIATIQVLPNVGRCDHTYAYYMSTVLDQKVEKGDEKDSIIVFLKDDMSAENLHQPGAWNDFGSMVRLASTTNGFACGIVPAGLYKMDDNNRYFMSAYHDVKALFNFTIVEHVRNAKGYASDGVEFKSVYANIGSFYDYLGAPAGPLPEIVQVCYGGIFAASVSNIKKRDMSIWKAIEKSLSRGNNIQEGHYAERSWGYLLSTPLQPFQVEALRNHSDTFSSKEGLLGMLKGALLKQGFRSRKGRKGFINSLRRVEPKT